MSASAAINPFFPRLDHLTFEDFEYVYEPCEDTYLICDALRDEVDYLKGAQPLVALEIGPGTGTVCTCLNLVIKSAGLPPPITLAVDVNPRACATTLATARENGVTSIDAIQADLAAPLLQRLAGTVDVLLFNPPYVPTPDEEVGGCDLSAAWAGGERGRRVLDRLLPRIPSLLTPPTPGYPGGCAYIIVLEENDPAELKSIAGSMGLAAACIASTKAKNERLHVLKLYWPPAATQDAAAQSAGAAES